MSRLDGWSNWERAFFNRLFFGNVDEPEIVFELPNRIRYPKMQSGVAKQTLARTNIHQSFWLGQDAPINLCPIESFELEFSPDSFDEYRKILEIGSLCALEPQPFCPMIWVPDRWLITAGGAGRTTWQLSRSTPYDWIDINYLDDYKPKCDVDGAALTLVTSGAPAAGQFLIEEGLESTVLETTDLAGGQILTLWYPAKFYVHGFESNEEVNDVNMLSLSISMKEFLPTRNYAFSVP